MKMKCVLGLIDYSVCSFWARNICRLDEECIDIFGGYICVCGVGFRRVNGICDLLNLIYILFLY